MNKAVYRCEKCTATKTIMKRADMTQDEFYKELPFKIPCGYRGCDGYAYADIQASTRKI
jgi:hypothetical protein